MSLLGGILKGVGGFITGGPAGAIAGVASELFKPKQSSPTSYGAPPTTATVDRLRQIAATQPILRPAINVATAYPPQFPDSTKTTSGVALPGGILVGKQTTTYGPGFGSPPPMLPAPQQASPGQGCHKGYHLNKTGYYSRKRGGWVPAGTVCVKNRRRNPLNPRALSRSISRISSAKNAARFLSRVTVREGGCGCK